MKTKPIKSQDLPTTRGMLDLVRKELKADNRSLSTKMDSRFSEMDSKFCGLESKFSGLESKMDKVLSEVARIGTLVEEQNSNNRIVLEGLTSLWQRQERSEARIEKLEKRQ